VTNPKISFVIIEYNSIAEVKNCIESIRENSKGIPIQIIVSSNSCYSLSTQTQLANDYSSAEWVFNKRNGGFAYGMNRGLSKGQGEYFAVVNPDAILLNGIQKMIEFLDQNPEVGVAGPQLIDSKGVIQDSCRFYVTLPRFIIRNMKRLILDLPVVHEKGLNYSLIQTVDWIIGAFMMVRRDAYIATKGMDENYLFYAEDMDWCQRIRKAGFEVVYFPLVRANYRGTRAARKLNRKSIVFLKSHFRFWKRNGFLHIMPPRSTKVFDYN
jgi:N-acetylglucosaminyl-diphospho-decaprenol L-rhamnosyltransferase